MTSETAADPSLGRLADGLLIPPFPGRSAPLWVLEALGEGLAGVTVFGPNIGSTGQLAELIARLRAARSETSGHEPIVAIDEEGGDVTRIAHLTGSPYPGNAALGAVDDAVLTRAVYRALGADLAALGVTLNLAPSVDVNTAADNPVIGTRSFGADPNLVARHAAAAVSGLQAAGVAACAKHFPGHGSTSIDSHHAVATVSGSMELITRRDLPPFVAAIEAGVRAVMPGHLLIPGLAGDLPASLSTAVQTGLLRGELGFDGVIVSDALEMRAVSAPYGIPEAAVMAVAAGTDLICFGRDQDQLTYLQVRDALVASVRSGRLPASRLEESAARVYDLRAWVTAARELAPALPADGVADAGGVNPAAAGAGGNGPGGTDVGLEAARRALTWEGELAPLADPVLVEIVPPSNIAVGMVPWGLSRWVRPDSVYRISTGPADVDSDAAPVTRGLLAATAAGRPMLIVVRDAHRYPVARSVVRDLLSARPSAVVVEMGLPGWHPPTRTYLVTFGATRASSLAAAELLGLAADLTREVSSDGPDRP
ncbi:MAG: glycoside hydrolase family 3 protein [Streptosporangiaceae bacterium]